MKISAPCLSLAVAALLHGSAAWADWQPPRTPWGVPDLQGIWDYSNRTALERHPRFEGDLIVSAARMMELVPSVDEYLTALEAVGAEAPGPDNVGAYNGFWTDPGDWLGMVDGQYRTSQIIYPEDGRVPWSEQGRQLRAAQRARMNFDGVQKDAGPEGFSLAERCLISFASVTPFMSSLYNNTVQIVQSPTHVMILAEMVHDARIVTLNAEHRDDLIPQWHGHSVGYYDGDELVVKTRGFHPMQVSRSGGYTSENAVITERFRLSGERALNYRFTIEDPELYLEPWTGEMEMRPTDALYEYACHEGNYSMPGILAGARIAETEAE